MISADNKLTNNVNFKENNDSIIKKKKKKKKNRCSFEGCRIKLKIHELDLKCTNCKCSYCPKHRTKENHKCIMLNSQINDKKNLNKNGLGGGKFDKLVKI